MSLKEERLKAGLTQQKMSEIMEIPKRTIENWESGARVCPPYVERLIIKELREIAQKASKQAETDQAVSQRSQNEENCP